MSELETPPVAPGGTEFERWLRAELAARYVELLRTAEGELLRGIETWKPAGIISGAVATAEHRYGLDVATLQPWTCRGGVWKRW